MSGEGIPERIKQERDPAGKRLTLFHGLVTCMGQNGDRLGAAGDAWLPGYGSHGDINPMLGVDGHLVWDRSTCYRQR